MPEGPEVKLFVDKIKSLFENKTLLKIEVLSGRYLKKPIKNIFSLQGKNLSKVSCKGKFIWFEFEDLVVFNTLGMTGSWSRNKSKHTRIVMTFTDNSELCFTDIRNFGTFQIKNQLDLAKKLKSIGPDMLSSPPDDFIKIIRKYNHKNICEVLMNQKIISGVGNYIKAESLWFARINPHAYIKDLTDNNLVHLEKAILFVINKSYKLLGASIKDYYTFDNEQGTATSSFVVYGRDKDVNNHNVIKETTLDKRTTHWVKERQTII